MKKLQLTPYTYIFNNIDNVKLSSLSKEELNLFIDRINEDLGDFERNQQNTEYFEMIDLWKKARTQALFEVVMK